MTGSPYPLAGIRVVAFEQAVSAPLCTRHLADLGADVIKVERIGEGDFARAYDSVIHGTSTWFAWLGRGKRSLTLDLKHERGREVAEKLCAGADVVISNFAPGAFDRLGLSVDQLHARFPRLVVASVTGYGESGPYRDRRAYDLLVQAEAGIVSLTGTPDEPSRAGVSVVDIAAGMYALSSILAALYRRQATGEGAAIKISLFDSIMEWAMPFSLMATHGPPPKRSGARHPSIVPYGPFPVAGGKTVVLAVQNEREWSRLCCDVLDRPGFVADPRFASNELRLRNRADLEPMIEEALSRLSLDEAEARLEKAAVAYSRMNEPGDVLDHPQVLARDRLLHVAVPGGNVDVLRSPFNIDGVDDRPEPVPAIGEHTGAVLRELGYDDAAIESLQREGAV